MTLMDCKVPNMDAYDATMKDGAGKASTDQLQMRWEATEKAAARRALGDRVRVSKSSAKTLEVIARSAKPMYCGPRHPKFSHLRHFVGRANTGA
jgi:hypothetical protein